MKKTNLNNPVVIGGVGNLWGDNFHQQDRVYKYIAPTVNARANTGMTVKKWLKPLDNVIRFENAQTDRQTDRRLKAA